MTVIALYENKTNTTPAVDSVTWDELVAMLSTNPIETGCWPCPGGQLCPKKDVVLWSPVVIEGTRLNDNIKAITFAVFDIDKIEQEQVDAFDVPGVAYILHSTHSHRPPESCSLRLVMPLTRPVLPHEWVKVFEAIVQTYSLPTGLKRLSICDDPSRAYYLPTHARGGPDFFSRVRDGGAIDVDAMLRVALRSPASPATSSPLDLSRFTTSALSAPSPTSASAPPTLRPPADPQPVDLKTLRKKVVELRATKGRSTDPSHLLLYLMLGRVLEGKAFVVPGGQEHAELPSGRDGHIHKIVSALVFKFGAAVPLEAVIEILRPSLADMIHEPYDFDHWVEVAAKSYARAYRSKVERDEREQTQKHQELAEIKRRFEKRQVDEITGGPTSSSRNGGASSSRGDEAAAGGASSIVSDDDEDDSWKDRLIHTAQGLKACGENVVVLLTQPRFRDAFRWNEFEKRIDVDRDRVPWKCPKSGVTDYDKLLAGEIVDWLQRTYKLTVSEELVGSRLLRVAVDNTYNPLSDYLRGLNGTWDKVPRIDRFFIDMCDAKVEDLSGADITGYLERVARCFFIALAARGIDPGCQVDNVVVLEGRGGKGKTSAFRELGGEWYCETAIQLGDKDSKMLASAAWIVELAELESMRKSETSAQKAFLTTRIDHFRPPYGKSLMKAPRMCVFVGTTNDQQWLSDRTGNRRWRPVALNPNGRIDAPRIRELRDQLFAEAVEAYMAGESWWFTDAEEDVAAEVAEERLIDDSMETNIAEWWFGLPQDRRPPQFNSSFVAKHVLRLDARDELARGVTTGIGMALRKLGFERRKNKGMGRVGYYVASRALLEAPVVATTRSVSMATMPQSAMLRLVEGGKKEGAT